MPKFVVLNNSAMAYILGIESSCDDTSAAVLKNTHMLSNVMASQDVHSKYGGVVPELASRAHQQHIVPVVSRALEIAGLGMQDMDAIAFTRGPGLLGSLLVGTSFAKGLSLAAGIPLIEVNHLTGHVLSHFIDVEPKTPKPQFPFLCLLVSGGHTQILQVNAPLTLIYWDKPLMTRWEKHLIKVPNCWGWNTPEVRILTNWQPKEIPGCILLPVLGLKTLISVLAE